MTASDFRNEIDKLFDSRKLKTNFYLAIFMIKELKSLSKSCCYTKKQSVNYALI